MIPNPLKKLAIGLSSLLIITLSVLTLATGHASQVYGLFGSTSDIKVQDSAHLDQLAGDYTVPVYSVSP